MCVLGLYLAFLLLENMITGNHSTNTTQNHNFTMNTAHNSMRFSKNIKKRSVGFQHILNATSEKPNKKWQLGKVTQKHDMINMLWRKTKVFLDEESIYSSTKRPTLRLNMLWSNTIRRLQSSTAKQLIHKKENIPIRFSTTSLLPLRTATSSKIEFYYMDDSHENKQSSKFYRNVEQTSSPPFLIFHLKGPFVEPIPMSRKQSANLSRFRSDQIRVSAIRLKEVLQLPKFADETFFRKVTHPIVTVAPNKQKYLKIEATKAIQTNSKVAMAAISTREEKILKQTTIKQTLRPSSSKEYFFDNNILMKRAILPPRNWNSLNEFLSNRYTYNTTESTTIYDKIKFFEMYDHFTKKPTPCTKKKLHVSSNNATHENIIDKILLQHVDEGSHGHNLAKLAKKHITENLNTYFLNETVLKSQAPLTNDTQKVKLDRAPCFMNESTKSEPNETAAVFSYVNETARWSDYPFAAVYIYEPSQVHCDAVAINTYWLIASGSCLSRVSRKVNDPVRSNNDGQSAFVSYCGDVWWVPERVAYVKYTVVHPKYHPRDKTRQHLFNIGAIQVVSSMISACSGWAPVALISHQFTTKANNTWATAIGWGLDRYDSRYGSSDLPKTPLMMYKSAIYFDSCPGNVGYSKAKRLDEGSGVKNVYCLSLPPYRGEETDPIHGGLLLANGKLIALYLQEERRPWGEQSAQYTSVWRLVPWIMDVAREPEEIETVVFEL